MVRKDVFGRHTRTVVLAVVAIVAAITASVIVDTARSQKEQDKPFVPKGRDEPDATPPVGLQRGSLLVRENLAPALRRLQARSGRGRVRALRIASDRVDAQVVTARGRLRTIRHRFTGETAVLSDTASPVHSTRATFAWSEVDTHAPRRIAQRVLRDRPARELSYLVLLDSRALRWSAFLTSGADFSATADGRDVRRTGG